MNKITVYRLFAEIRKVFGNELWEINTETLSNARRRLVRFIKLIRITVDEFAENKMGYQCVALSYFGVFAVIPLAAFIFSVSGGFGLTDKIEGMVKALIPADPNFLDVIISKAEGIAQTAQSSLVGVISLLILVWSVIWLMYHIERVFNNVWKIRKIPRKIYKRFSFYIGALILSPFLVIAFGAGFVIYTNMTSLIGIHINIKELSFLMTILGWVIMYAFVVLTFSVMYKYIPAVKVKYRNAFWAALVSGFVFIIFQYLYLETQTFVSRLNGVYGTLAAVPLFMMWMNYSWQIVLYGAQLCYGLQNVDSYNIPEGKLQDFKPMRDRLKREIKEEIES